MSEYKPGEIVDITIKGARVDDTDEVGNLEFTYPGPEGTSFEGVVVLGLDAVTVERVAPAEWPPRTGDLWRAETGMLYLALQNCGDGVDLVHLAGDTIPADELLNRRPSLVHREEASES